MNPAQKRLTAQQGRRSAMGSLRPAREKIVTAGRGGLLTLDLAVRLAPFGNLWGARVILDEFAESSGLPERRN